MKKILCIDGNSLLNRAFYGIRILTNREGFPTNALYGLTNIISRHLEDLQPDYAVIAYDLKAPTFRHKMYAEYKAGRHAMPPELAQQMPVSQTFASMLGLHILSMEGYEADDILGTVSAMAEASPEPCMAYLLTGDKDSLQLISPRVHVLLAGNDQTTDMDETAFMNRYGVRPDQFVDVKALMGDTSDHIPGVPGIGEKTALKLIAEYGTLDALYEALPTASHTPSLRRKLEAGQESAFMSRTLARICREVPLTLTLEDVRTRPMDRKAARELFTKYEFAGFIKRFHLTASESDAAGADISPAPQPEAAVTPSDVQSKVATSYEKAEATISSTALDSAEQLAHFPAGTYALWFEEGVLSLSHERQCFTCPVTEAQAASVAAFLNNPQNTFLCHDCKTLYKHLSTVGVHFRRCGFDTMLAAYVVEAGLSDYSLEKLALTWLGRVVQPQEVTLSLVEDLMAPLSERLTATGQMQVFQEIELPLAAVLADMELAGFKIDRQAVHAYGQALDALIADMEARIYTMAGKPFNILSPKQLGEVLFEDLMLPAGKKTKTGYSTSAEVLEKLRRYHPIVSDVLDYRQYTKLRSTYVEGLLKVADTEGCIHTTFKQTGTATGRLSSAEPNLQNIPIRTELGREMRKFFIPSQPDHVLIDADYSQIELRLLADIAGDSAMREAFLSGFDIHTDTASRIFGVDKDHVTIEQRKKAKAINFGLMYGMGEFSLAEDLHISRMEAKSYMDSYMDSYPDIERYLDEIVKVAYAQGFVTTKYGRRRMIPELAEPNKMRKKFGERVAMNSPIQGTAADIIKIAMIRVHHRLAESGLDARMILQVHDELILEASCSCAHEAMALLKEEMEKAAQLSVPLVAEASMGKNWVEAH